MNRPSTSQWLTFVSAGMQHLSHVFHILVFYWGRWTAQTGFDQEAVCLSCRYVRAGFHFERSERNASGLLNQVEMNRLKAVASRRRSGVETFQCDRHSVEQQQAD